ncbi:CBS domain-containing protein [Uliginosibacterium sp. H3]|uniref:CBS domain-containing protein n=1 Tax=Uliginosibacterium silvisoli TaxID=3114758 RepID=A0ABU6K8P7_9RHOO|nr:CBS domain-containing protein [Uliginosibacterium sp. H3]
MLVSEILALKGSVLYTVGPQHTLQEAVTTMTDLDIGSVVVVEDGKMVGLLTFREMLSALKRVGMNWREAKVSGAMIAKPVVASPDMEVEELQRLIVEHHQRYLPVMDGDVLQGVISFHDVARAMLEEKSFENKMLKSYIRNWPEEDEISGESKAAAG